MSTASGHAAEETAANYLMSQGLEVLERNWKTRWCEIDIVAKQTNRRGMRPKQEIIRFIEVKYRRSSAHGQAVEYVTKRKAEQLQFAARWWVNEHDWQGDYQIDVIGVDGASGAIDYIPNAIGF